MAASQSTRIPSRTSLQVAIEDWVCVASRARESRLLALMSLHFTPGARRTLNQDAAGTTDDRYAHEAAASAVVFTLSTGGHAKPVHGRSHRHRVQGRMRSGPRGEDC